MTFSKEIRKEVDHIWEASFTTRLLKELEMDHFH